MNDIREHFQMLYAALQTRYMQGILERLRLMFMANGKRQIPIYVFSNSPVKMFLVVGNIAGVIGSKCQVPLPAGGLLVKCSVEPVNVCAGIV